MANSNLSSFIWSVADLLRGDYKQSEYGKVILPFTVLRRLDCVLEPTKAAVLAEKVKREKAGLNPESFLLKKSGQLFYNTDALDLKKLMGDQDHIGENLRRYLQGFSSAVRDIFERFEFHIQIDRLDKSRLLYLVTEKFANIDLHPDVVSNAEMGAVFEELIRRFAELSNETAGEHFTPREVIRLMVNLLFIEDDDALSKPGVVRSIYDPTAGTGGMLTRCTYLFEHASAEFRRSAKGYQRYPAESFRVVGGVAGAQGAWECARTKVTSSMIIAACHWISCHVAFLPGRGEGANHARSSVRIRHPDWRQARLAYLHRWARCRSRSTSPKRSTP